MKTKRRSPIQTVRLRFDEDADDLEAIRGEISTCDVHGRTLFLAHDESSAVERLIRHGVDADGQERSGGDAEGYADHERFPLADFIKLPEDDGEMDIEGLAFDPPWLWVTGSMSLKRKKADKDDDQKSIKKLAGFKVDRNRFTLAKIPCEQTEDGVYTPVESLEWDGRTMTPHYLEGGPESTVLTELLTHDEHLGPYLDLPCKENGFDVEGIAVLGERLFLGLRGPVLRGYAVILELHLTELDGRLRFANRDDHSPPYRKHFLDLAGMGIRELRIDNDSGDLFILAGPTMDLDGTIALWRIRGGLGDDGDTSDREPERLFDVVRTDDLEHGHDKAEGFATLTDGRCLIAYDSPVDDRLVDDNAVLVDMFSLKTA